jgi:hypothetical protein
VCSNGRTSSSIRSFRPACPGALHNVYRAFDFREEEQIYDGLAKSAERELLGPNPEFDSLTYQRLAPSRVLG